MVLHDKPFSTLSRNVLGGMLCLALMACPGAVYGTGPEKPDKADVQNNGERVRLRDEPALRKPVSGELRNPKPQDIVDLVRNQTGQRLSLDASVIQDRPLQGNTGLRNVPAWAALENLARNKYIQGYWTKRGDEYVLIATYSGKPPPLPREPPPRLRAAMEKAAKGLPPDPPPKREHSPKRTQRRIWWATSSLTFAAIFVGILFWRRKPAPSTTSETSLPKESK